MGTGVLLIGKPDPYAIGPGAPEYTRNHQRTKREYEQKIRTGLAGKTITRRPENGRPAW